MAHLIDKDAAIAEIDKCYNECLKRAKVIDSEYWNAKADAYRNALVILENALEVKEVDLEKEIQDHIKECLDIKFPTTDIELIKKDVAYTARKFYELGLKAKNWEKERMEECPYRQVGCTMYEGEILECRGACSWVIDYPKLKELKTQKGKKV